MSSGTIPGIKEEDGDMHYGTREGCLRIQAGDAGGSVMAEPFQRQRSQPRDRGTGRSGGEQPH